MAYEKIHMENLLKEKDELELEIAQLKTDVIDYCRALEECKKENARLRELLRRYEWSGPNGNCPDCGWTVITGHPSLCDLRKALEGDDDAE